jgi:hypothetical protein
VSDLFDLRLEFGTTGGAVVVTRRPPSEIKFLPGLVAAAGLIGKAGDVIGREL